MFENIEERRRAVQENIAKSFIDNEDSSDIEKAKWNDGDHHPNKPWIWKQSANGGKGDWRAIPKSGSTSSSSTKVHVPVLNNVSTGQKTAEELGDEIEILISEIDTLKSNRVHYANRIRKLDFDISFEKNVSTKNKMVAERDKTTKEYDRIDGKIRQKGTLLQNLQTEYRKLSNGKKND